MEESPLALAHESMLLWPESLSASSPSSSLPSVGVVLRETAGEFIDLRTRDSLRVFECKSIDEESPFKSWFRLGKILKMQLTGRAFEFAEMSCLGSKSR